MAIKIPLGYDYKMQEFDPLEMTIRDSLKINIENWAKFRHTITASVNANSLISVLPVSPDIKSSYLELSKSHYEVVTMLGATKISLNSLEEFVNKDHLIFKKSFKEFYMHAGSVLDNLARLIYIVNVSNGVSTRDRYNKLIRHTIGYGQLKKIYLNNKPELKGYNNIVKSKAIHEIKNIRNNFTHSWPPTIFIDQNTNEFLWPNAMRKKSQYYLWPHDPEEIRRIRREYKKRVPLVQMVRNDWLNLEQFQNKVFKRLYKDIRKFERNHNLEIV
ncbi:MAG: hypothetical protein JWP94_290 [Mucilaginibacter sp.]|nr:hypothetical protein [Mucilaginibacter sp.]